MPGSPLLGSWGPSCLRWKTRGFRCAAVVTLLLTPVLEGLERDLAVHGVLRPTLRVLSRNPRNLSKSSGADTDGFMLRVHEILVRTSPTPEEIPSPSGFASG